MVLITENVNYISVENVSKSFGERVIFQDISFGINKDQKIAFIAKNGSGKTTLLNIITGKDTPDSGNVVFRKELNWAYLPQNPQLNGELTVEETIFSLENPILKVIHRYEKALENAHDEDNYQAAFEEMEKHKAWDFENQYKQILSKLKLNNLSTLVKNLSGGEKKRLALANLIISKPELLILDEPTNHLDLEMIEWLEEYFAKEKITLFMVTHDRYFLERVCNEIVELEDGKLYSYRGNYSYFLEKKEQRISQEQASVEKAKNLYTRELDWMRRQPKARTTKSKSRIDDFYKIREQAQKRRKEHTVQLEINMERLGSKIVELHNVGKAFGEKKIIDRFDYVFKKGERVGVVGKNGTGKTTLLNIITGNLAPDKGKVVVGDTIKFGYYRQKAMESHGQEKVIDVIKKFGEYIPLAKGRELSAGQLLERFLFDRKKQYDFVEKLSGGELKRLYLCTVLIQNPNFLILDEPTNDLDIVTLNVLEDFLLDYPGCIVVVSHDRYFMDKIVDHIFVFKENGTIDDFPGNYTDYREYESSTEPKEQENTNKNNTKNSWKANNLKGLDFNEQKQYNKLEREIGQLEDKKKEIEELFTLGEMTTEQIRENSEILSNIISEIEDKTTKWFELYEKLEN